MGTTNQMLIFVISVLYPSLITHLPSTCPPFLNVYVLRLVDSDSPNPVLWQTLLTGLLIAA